MGYSCPCRHSGEQLALLKLYLPKPHDPAIWLLNQHPREALTRAWRTHIRWCSSQCGSNKPGGNLLISCPKQTHLKGSWIPVSSMQGAVWIWHRDSSLSRWPLKSQDLLRSLKRRRFIGKRGKGHIADIPTFREMVQRKEPTKED